MKMPNSNTIVEKNLSNEQRAFTKDLRNLKETLVKQTMGNTRHRRKKNITQTTINNNKEQDLEKIVSKPHITRKVNLNDKKKIIEINTSKTSEDKKKSLGDSSDSQVPNAADEMSVKTKSQTKNIRKILSPNHKLTEYFSHLKVNEHPKNDVTKEAYLKKAQDSKTSGLLSQNDVLCTKSLQDSTLLLAAEKKLCHCKIKSNIDITNHKVTEYFHVRRSQRNHEKSIIDEKQKELEKKIHSKSQDGLKIKEFEGKGRGIVTTKEFRKGDFIIEYIGDLIDGNTAKQREMQYAKNKNIGCYMYYFKHKNKQYCIDATEESDKLGRLINHSRKGNLISKIIEINEIPRLVLFAKTDIPIGTEVLYDYGDRSRESVRNHPWLSS